MIKKYKEFNESKELDKMPLLKEDVEDQFLRLKEIIGCIVFVEWMTKSQGCILEDHNFLVDFCYPSTYEPNAYEAHDRRKLSKIKEDEIQNELEQIKTRMESMYPVSVEITDYTNRSIKVDDFYYRIKIESRIN